MVRVNVCALNQNFLHIPHKIGGNAYKGRMESDLLSSDIIFLPPNLGMHKCLFLQDGSAAVIRFKPEC